MEKGRWLNSKNGEDIGGLCSYNIEFRLKHLIFLEAISTDIFLESSIFFVSAFLTKLCTFTFENYVYSI